MKRLHILMGIALAGVGAIAPGQDDGGRRDAENGPGADRDAPGTMRADLALLRALDANRDRRLSRDEIDRAVAALRALDTNGDGKIEGDELSVPGGDARLRPGANRDRTDVWRALAEKYDRDSSGEITRDEYSRGEERFATLDRDGDGKVSEEDFRGRGRRPGAGRPNGEASAVGAVAPDFELARAGEGGKAREDGTVRLSSYRGKKPVALVFGSYT